MDGQEAKRVFDALLGGRTPSALEICALIHWITKEHERRAKSDAHRDEADAMRRKYSPF